MASYEDAPLQYKSIDPRYQLATFGGKGAQGWLKEFAERFAEMEGKEDPRHIWRRLGVMRGADDQLRFEIPDHQARMKIGNQTNPVPNHRRAPVAPMYRLGEVLDHPQLYENYPGIDTMGVMLSNDMPRGNLGEYHEADEWIKMNRNLPEEDARRVLLHEVQHSLQAYEDFGRGANQQYWPDPVPVRAETYREMLDYADTQFLRDLVRRYGPDEALQQFKATRGRAPGPRWQTLLMLPEDELDRNAKRVKQRFLSLQYADKPEDLYRKASGEVESRNVERRSKMSGFEGRQHYPGDTQDVPFYDQIVLRGNVRY